MLLLAQAHRHPAKFKRDVPSDLEKARFLHPVVDVDLRDARRALVGPRRTAISVVQGYTCGEEHGRLIAVPEWQRTVLNLGTEGQSEAGRDKEVARPFE